MPIFVNDYEWHQNGSVVTLKFGLRGRKSQNVDIVFTSSYIKVNFSPYLFEAFLSHKIDPASSSSWFKDGLLHFNIIKVCNQEWDSFSIKPVDKNESQKLRKEAVDEFNLLQISKVQSKQEVVRELSKLAISKQLEVNEKQNELYKKNLIEETNKFFSNACPGTDITTQGDEQSILRTRSISTCSEEGSCATSEGDYDGDEESVYHSSFENIPALVNQNLLFKEAHCKMKEKVAMELQGPRQCSIIKICHSSHKLGTPKRKSTIYLHPGINEDNKIASRQEQNVSITSVKKENFQITKINNNIVLNEDNLEEISYDDMKKEAKQNFENGKHEETIRLYSKMIKMNRHHASNYSNRAASYLALNMNAKTVKDCTMAITLLEPPTQENIKSRLLCFIRRGTAYVRLYNYQRGLIDYKTALLLDPENGSLAKDIAAITLFLNISSDTGEEEDARDNTVEVGLKI